MTPPTRLLGGDAVFNSVDVSGNVEVGGDVVISGTSVGDEFLVLHDLISDLEARVTELEGLVTSLGTPVLGLGDGAYLNAFDSLVWSGAKGPYLVEVQDSASLDDPFMSMTYDTAIRLADLSADLSGVGTYYWRITDLGAGNLTSATSSFNLSVTYYTSPYTYGKISASGEPTQLGGLPYEAPRLAGSSGRNVVRI